MRNPKIVLAVFLSLFVLSLTYSCKRSKPVTPGASLPPVNLIAHWKLDGNAIDASRYGNNGTAFNTTIVADRFGNATGALQFNGTNGYIAVPDNAPLRLGNTDFTLNVWVKMSSFSYEPVSTIISKRFSGFNNGWIWGINGSQNSNIGPLGSIYYGPGGGNQDAAGNTAVPLNQWTMVTCVYTLSTQTVQIYINGSIDKSITGVATANNTVAAPLYIGLDQMTPGQQQYFFNGAMDDIRIYNTGLAQSDITSLYQATQ